MSTTCTDLDQMRPVTPSALGCEECLRIGSEWVHLRECQICGRVGCCDSSPLKHATKHFHATGHPITLARECGIEAQTRTAGDEAGTPDESIPTRNDHAGA
jgi:ubiquitin-hydrolase Zn-finger-containing protein